EYIVDVWRPGVGAGASGTTPVRACGPLLQLALVGRAESTVVNVLLARWPRVVMAPMQTTMMRASITAYSTAVGPSSRFRNVTMSSEERCAGTERTGRAAGWAAWSTQRWTQP